MANAKIVNIKDQDGNILNPQTLMSQVVEQDGQLLEELILPKDNTSQYTPTSNYNPATKYYVDNVPRVKIITSIRQPTDMQKGDIWYQQSADPYTWQEVDDLNYTWADIDALNMTWAEFDMGGW